MRFIATLLILACVPFSAQAYVGPGAGLGAIVVTLAIVLGLVLLVIGFLWYPLKRLLRRSRSGSKESAAPGVDAQGETKIKD
jgi:Kef-type K+ transport system membrane component KefB